MKEVLAKQAVKFLCAAIFYPVMRFVLMPMLMASVSAPTPGQPGEKCFVNRLPSGEVSQGPTVAGQIPFANGMSPHEYSANARQQFDEVSRMLNSNNGPATPGATTPARRAASTSKAHSVKSTVAKTTAPVADYKSRSVDLGGHTMTITPSKNAANSVVIDPGTKSSSQPAKCAPGKS